MSTNLPIVQGENGNKYQPLPNSSAAQAWEKEKSWASCKKTVAAAAGIFAIPLVWGVIPLPFSVPVAVFSAYCAYDACAMCDQAALDALRKHGEENDWDGFEVVYIRPVRPQIAGSDFA